MSALTNIAPSAFLHRAGLQLEVDAGTAKMGEAAAAQIALVLQRDTLQGIVNTLDERCVLLPPPQSSIHLVACIMSGTSCPF